MPVREKIVEVEELDVATQDEVESLLSNFVPASQFHSNGEGSIHSGIMHAMEHPPCFANQHQQICEAWEE